MADGCADVVIKALQDIHEVTVRVPLKATISDVKLMLSKELSRPEIMQTGKFVVTQNDVPKPILESQKLGPRRELLFIGAPLYPAPVEAPPKTIEDFDCYDLQDELIESPRTLKACDGEGIDPEELFYTPLEAFATRGVPKRLAQLRHDFFEAVRQDTVEIVKHARNLIIGEEEAPWKSHVSSHGPGNWGGPLAPHAYPVTHRLFQDLTAMTAHDKVLERPKSLPLKGAALAASTNGGGRWAPAGETEWFVDASKPSHIMTALSAKDADISTTAVEIQSEDIEDALEGLKALPAGSGEQVAGLPLRTSNVVVSQLEDNATKLRQVHQGRREVVNKQVEIAESQMEFVDDRMEEVEVKKELREKLARASMSNWKTGLQKANATAAGKRVEHWQDRRAVVHYASIADEAERRERMQHLLSKDLERERRVANMRNLARIHFARTWVDRRTAWGKNYLIVTQGPETSNALIMHKHKEASARITDQRHRTQCLIDFKREMKSLRRALVSLAKERDERRQDFRRHALASELKQLSMEASTRLPSSPSRTTGNFSPYSSLTFGSSMHSETTQPPPSQPTSHASRFPRFDWGRFGAESVSPTAARGKASTATAGEFSRGSGNFGATGSTGTRATPPGLPSRPRLQLAQGLGRSASSPLMRSGGLAAA